MPKAPSCTGTGLAPAVASIAEFIALPTMGTVIAFDNARLKTETLIPAGMLLGQTPCNLQTSAKCRNLQMRGVLPPCSPKETTKYSRLPLRPGEASLRRRSERWMPCSAKHATRLLNEGSWIDRYSNLMYFEHFRRSLLLMSFPRVFGKPL